MLPALLIIVAFLLVTTNLIAFTAKRPSGKITGICLAIAFGQIFLGFWIPMATLLPLLLIVALGIWRCTTKSPAFYLGLSGVASLIAFAVATGMALRSEREYDRLRELYAYQSIESRLPLLNVSLRPRPLTPESVGRLDRLDTIGWDLRERRLKMLHEEKVDLFIHSFGFGYSRMPPEPSATNLDRVPASAPLQPGPRTLFPMSPGEWLPARPGDEAAMGRMLEKGILGFANPENFGYAKDRQHVAGFQPHVMTSTPDRAESWHVRTLDLVGLLLEPEPRVYVSDRLPSMDQVRKVPTRPLDKVELAGLTALRDGDDLWITRAGDNARMVGAIRNNNRCVACHGGEKGDLLGAFSYALAWSDSINPDPTQP